MRRASRALAVALPLLVLTGAAACSESDEDRRDAYCEQVKADSEELTRITDEGDAGGFLTALPILEGLAEKSPSDLKDEWQTFLNALHGLEDAVDEAGVDPDEIGKKLPADLAPADRRRVREAATVLQEPGVAASASAIEQHALDICQTPIL